MEVETEAILIENGIDYSEFDEKVTIVYINHYPTEIERFFETLIIALKFDLGSRVKNFKLIKYRIIKRVR